MAEDLQLQMQQQLTALAHKHATVSYALIGVLILVLGLAGVGGWLGLRFADAQLARAEKAEAQYNADRKTFTDTLALDAAQRAAVAGQQQVIVKVVDTRDKQANQAIQQALAPNATAQTAAVGLGSVYSSVPTFGTPVPTPDGNVSLTVPQTQQVTASKLDLDRTKADLVDEQKIYGLEQQKNVSLQLDLTASLKSDQECEVVVQKYKKAAKAGRFRKVVRGAVEVVAVVGAFYLGHKY